MELSIVMPCLNEAETLGTCIQKARSFLNTNSIEGEIVVGDNGSTDGSKKIAQEMGAIVVEVSQKGYGAALRGAIEAANGRYIIMGDSDDSYDFLRLEHFVNELRNGGDLVMGNRFKGGIQKGAMPFLHQFFGNPVLSAIGRLFFRVKVGDFYCGLRGFQKSAYHNMKLVGTGMEFALEMVFKAAIFNMDIREVPTTLSPDGRSRKPHLRTWSDGWQGLRFMLLFAPRWLFLYPGLAILTVSTLLFILLLYQPIVINDVVFDVHTLLYYGVAILVGLQFVFFYIFSRVYGVVNGFLPALKSDRRWMPFIDNDQGIWGGLLICLLSFIFTGANVYYWYSTGFGDLDAYQFMRRVIPAALSLVIGFQMLLFSFMIGMIKIKPPNV